MVFIEDKSKLLVQSVIGVFVVTMMVGVFYLQGLPAKVAIWCIILFLFTYVYIYFRNLKRDYFVKLSDSFVEYCNTCQSKSSRKYKYSDIRKIEPYWRGVVLYLEKGHVRRLNIETVTIRDGRELKKKLVEKWTDFKESSSTNPPPRKRVRVPE